VGLDHGSADPRLAGVGSQRAAIELQLLVEELLEDAVDTAGGLEDDVDHAHLDDDDVGVGRGAVDALDALGVLDGRLVVSTLLHRCEAVHDGLLQPLGALGVDVRKNHREAGIGVDALGRRATDQPTLGRLAADAALEQVERLHRQTRGVDHQLLTEPRVEEVQDLSDDGLDEALVIDADEQRVIVGAGQLVHLDRGDVAHVVAVDDVIHARKVFDDPVTITDGVHVDARKGEGNGPATQRTGQCADKGTVLGHGGSLGSDRFGPIGEQ